jgi:hypothetical protein
MRRALIAALAAPATATAAVQLRPGDILVAGVTRNGNGAVFRVDPGSGRQTLVSSGALLFSPSDIGGSIVAIDPDKPGAPQTNQTLVSNNNISVTRPVRHAAGPHREPDRPDLRRRRPRPGDRRRPR